MARTQAIDYDDRREAIIETAARLYGETGFLGSSIADLAKACGMSKSLLYHYFASKEDILFEIMIEHITRLNTVAAGVAAIADPAQRLHAITRGFVLHYRHAQSRHKVLVNDLDKLPPGRRAKIVALERCLLDVVDQIIAELVPGLRDNKAHRRTLTMLYFGMINWTHTWFRSDGAITPDELADTVIELFLKGLRG